MGCKVFKGKLPVSKEPVVLVLGDCALIHQDNDDYLLVKDGVDPRKALSELLETLNLDLDTDYVFGSFEYYDSLRDNLLPFQNDDEEEEEKESKLVDNLKMMVLLWQMMTSFLILYCGSSKGGG